MVDVNVVDINEPWVVDDPLSTRFPVYTRGNVEEVTPDVTSPLQWSAFAGPYSEQPWKEALIKWGAFEPDEFRDGMQDIQAVIHGYIYINLSCQWVYGVRMPGADPAMMSRVYLGERAGSVEYRPHPDDKAPQLTERMQRSIQETFETDPRPRLADDAVRAEEIRAARPDLTTMTDKELISRYEEVMAEYHDVLVNHFLLVYQSSMVSGLLDSVLAPLEDSTLAVQMLAGWGDVASAAPSMVLWDLGRQVRDSAVLTEIFDAGADGLIDRLRQNSDRSAVEFVKAFDDFIYHYGSRSTSEYEAMPASWETDLDLPLGLIDRLRLQSEDNDPRAKMAVLARKREDLVAEVDERLAGDAEAQGTFRTAMKLVEWYMPAREQSKTTMVRLLHEARVPFREIARRRVETGELRKVHDLSMLRLDEVREFIADASPWQRIIDERWHWRDRLQELEPPYIVDGEVPSVDGWVAKQAADYQKAVTGETLTGVGACPGVATGRSRVIMSPNEARDLEPGEILVAPETDPGWTPLFLSAAGVVVNVGNQLSHAAIVSRELGIPAVLGIEGATKRIPDGTMITVDGTSGTVTVHE